MTPVRDRELGAALDGALPSPVPSRGAKRRVRLALNDRPRVPHARRTRAWLLGVALAGVVACALVCAGRRPRTPAPRAEDTVMSLGFARVLLRPGARLDVERDEETHATVRLVSGLAFFHVQKGPGRHFEVIAGDTRVEVVGTVFAVSFVPPSDVHVEVAEGVVRVQDLSGEHRVEAGVSLPPGTVLFDDAGELSVLRAPVTEIGRVPDGAPAASAGSVTGAEARAEMRPAYPGAAGVSIVAPERRSPAEAVNPYTMAKRLELAGDRDAALAAYERLSREHRPLAEDALFALVRLHAARAEHTAALAAAGEYRRRFAVGRYGRDIDVRILDAHLALGDTAAVRREAEAFLGRYPDDPRTWRFHLARAALLSRDGNCDAALVDLRHVPGGEAKERVMDACANH